MAATSHLDPVPTPDLERASQRQARPASRPRAMLPREHGAYAQLALPLVAALVGSRPTWAGASFAVASCAAFVAHEPALVLLGHRGSKALRESGPRARVWLAGSGLLAASFGAAAFALAPSSRAATALPAVLGIAASIMAFRREERTLTGELLASTALASAAVPTAIAGGVSWSAALGLWAVFSATSVAATVTVRAIARRGERLFPRIFAWIAAGLAVCAVGLVHLPMALTSLPVLGVSVALTLRPPPPTALRRLGWMLATASLAMAVGAAIALRV